MNNLLDKKYIKIILNSEKRKQFFNSLINKIFSSQFIIYENKALIKEKLIKAKLFNSSISI